MGLHYVLLKMIVKEIMVKNHFTVSPDMPAEEALQLGQEKGYGAFPVMENKRLVGMVTESDIVRMMTRVLGVKEKRKRIDIRAFNEFGNVKKIMEILDKNKTVLLSMMTLPIEKLEKYWLVVLRLKSEDAGPIAMGLGTAGFNVTYVG